MNGGNELQKAYEAILNNDFEQAAEWFEKAIAAEPDNADYRYRLSITYSRSNKLLKAIEHAKEAARLDPDKELYRLHVATLKARRLVVLAEKELEGSSAQPYLAIALLKQAIGLDPLNVEAYLLLGIASDALGDYPQAVQAMKEVLRLDPQHDTARVLVQDYEFKLKRYLGTDNE